MFSAIKLGSLEWSDDGTKLKKEIKFNQAILAVKIAKKIFKTEGKKSIVGEKNQFLGRKKYNLYCKLY